VQIALALEVQQPSGRGHDNIGPGLCQLPPLLIVIHAAEYRVDGHVGVLCQLLGLFGDLHHQFPRGTQDQNTSSALARF
jgi:hypothetical protein